MRYTPFAVYATAALLLLSACGGGGSDAPSAPTGSSPTAVASGVSYGTITQFGSIWVNGVEYDTNAATFRLDDHPGSQSDLRVGMVVRIDGSVDDRSAIVVTVDDALKGRVEQVLDAHRMIVMGQTVRIDAQTRFENGTVPVAGDVVEVHGLVAGDGAVAAGFIERKTTLASPSFAVKGLVRSHDAAAKTFAIGTLAVTYATGATINDMPAASWNGLQVEVKGTACAGNPVCGTLTASQVEPGGMGVEDTAHTEFEGFVNRLTANGFMLGAQTVVVTPGTRFEGGVAADIGIGTKLEVEGSLSGGVLTASKVSLRDNVRLEGDVASVDTARGTFRLTGLAGVTISVDSLTELKSLSSMASLGVANHVQVRGRAGSGNAVTASQLELQSVSPASRVVVRGALSAISGTSSVTLLGIVVDTGEMSESEFKAHDEAPIGRAAFFASLKVGSLVKARGKLGGGASVGWDEMELED